MKRELFFVVAALCTVCMVSCKPAPKGEMAYPQAEWSEAGEILMHTPGAELFNGVIHPSAGLFEHYFDVEQAAAEHREYIRLLEKNGIRVHTVYEMLNETGIDTLQALAAKVLKYDISAIPGEDAEASEAYRVQTIEAMRYIQNPLMNLYFTRDQSITTPRGHVICKMNSSQRAPETDIIEVCYHHLGVDPVLRIEGEGRLEGGDYFPAGTVSLIGCGMRTNQEGIRQVMEADAFGHDTVVVVRDHKFWQMQMAKPDEPEYATCDIYARAAGEKEYRLITEDIPFVGFLRERGMQIIPIDREDEMHYANNYLTIAPRHIMAVGGQSAALQQRLRDAGVKVEWVPLESLIDGYGAAHCMTQVMNRMKH